jgi:hypothetical protein
MPLFEIKASVRKGHKEEGRKVFVYYLIVQRLKTWALYQQQLLLFSFVSYPPFVLFV